MRTFGAFSAKGGKPFYGELIGDEVSVLARPFWLSIEPTGEKIGRRDLEIGLPLSPSKLIAVGLNYAEHIAEMKRTPLGTPLIWFKAPTSLLAHKQDIEIAFPEHQTDFEVELGIVLGTAFKLRASPGLVLPVAIVGSLIMSPYLHGSDLCLLSVAAWILWEERTAPAWRVSLALGWVLGSPFLLPLGLSPSLNRWPWVDYILLVALVVGAWRPLTGTADLRTRAPA